MMQPWEVWVRSTGLSYFVLHRTWVWATFEILHYIGLSLLLGTVGLFDLRVLGMAKGIAPAALHRLVPWGIAGYLINLLTGVTFFAGYPEQYAYNSAFHFKLAFMALAALNIAVFYSTTFREVRLLPADADASIRAKIITGFSLFAWVGVLVCGRLLTWYRPPYFH